MHLLLKSINIGLIVMLLILILLLSGYTFISLASRGDTVSALVFASIATGVMAGILNYIFES